jgi:adenylate kinase family enzyme
MRAQMQRIVILGCSGSGKSTLARRMGEKLGLPVVHLDALYWLPGWVERGKPAFRALVAQALAGERWICDGGYTSTYDLRLPRADTVIWLDRPRWLCVWRVITRWLTHIGRTRADMGPGCPEKVDWAFIRFIWTWEKRKRPLLEAALAEHAPQTARILLSNDAEITRFLDSLPPPLIPAEAGIQTFQNLS